MIVNANSIVEHVTQIKCQCECKNYRKCKKYFSWNPSTCTCENSKYLKNIAHTSVIKCDEIICYGCCINKNDKYSNKFITKNCHSKKARYKIDCYILLAVLLVIILLLIIT